MEDVDGVFFQHAIREPVFAGAGSPFCDFLRPVPRFIHLVDFQLGAGKDFTIQALLAAGFGVVLDVVPLGNGGHRLFVLDSERQCSVVGIHWVFRQNHQFVLIRIFQRTGFVEPFVHMNLVLGIHRERNHHDLVAVSIRPGHVVVLHLVDFIRCLGLHQDIGAFLGNVGCLCGDGTIRLIILTKAQLTLSIRDAVIGRRFKAALCSIIDGGVGQRELRAGEHLFILTVQLFQQKLFRLFGHRCILHGGEMLFWLGNGTV